MEIRIRFFLYYRKLKEVNVDINKDNYFIVKFLLIRERDKIRKKFAELRDKGIIKVISKPKIKDKKYAKYVNDLILSRKTIARSINVIKLNRHI